MGEEKEIDQPTLRTFSKTHGNYFVSRLLSILKRGLNRDKLHVRIHPEKRNY